MDWRNGKATNEAVLDEQNRKMQEQLSRKVSSLKSIAFDIETETKDHNRLLDGLDMDFSSSQSLLTGTLKRVQYLTGSNRTGRCFTCYIALFLVVLFFIMYYLVGWIRSS